MVLSLISQYRTKRPKLKDSKSKYKFINIQKKTPKEAFNHPSKEQKTATLNYEERLQR